MEQRTDDWFAARLGKVTASRAADVCAKGKGATRDNYMAQLICEILSQKPTESFTTPAMHWGIDQEPHARAAYSAKTGNLVDEVGFIEHPEIEGAGASPDGVVEEDGLIEIKCQSLANSLDFILTEKIPSRYRMQMQWQMACTAREYCDFVSYDPRLPEHLQLKVVHVERDQEEIDFLEGEVKAFLAEMNEKLEKLKEVKL